MTGISVRYQLPEHGEQRWYLPVVPRNGEYVFFADHELRGLVFRITKVTWAMLSGEPYVSVEVEQVEPEPVGIGAIVSV